MKTLFPLILLINLIATILINTQICLQAQSNSLAFDGADDYVLVNDTILNTIGTGDFTFEARVQGDEAVQSSHPMIFSNRINNAYSSGILFFFHSAWSGSSYKLLTIQIGPSNQVLNGNGTYNASILDNTCHHVAISREGQVLSYYIDGTLAGSKTMAASNMPTVSSPNPLWIGRDFTTNNTFEGNISHVRIWNVARTEAEISANINEFVPGDTPGLLAYWKMSEGEGQIVANQCNTMDGQLGSAVGSDTNDPIWSTDNCVEIICPTEVADCEAYTSTPLTSQSIYCHNDDIQINAGDYNTTTAYTQTYIAVQNNTIITFNDDGIFENLSSGTYEIYALNYEIANPPSLVIGGDVSEIINNQEACFQLSNAIEITILEPLKITVTSLCDEGVTPYTAIYNFTGGLPEYVDQNGSVGIEGDNVYNTTGEFIGEYLYDFPVSIQYPSSGSTTISIEDAIGCKAHKITYHKID